MKSRYNTFTGVFTPTLLSILGVILYLRVGWVVGNAGLFWAMGILLLACGITVCTGLCLSSIATNTRIGDGGPYAILNKSLGIEVGGSIGIPLYLTRPLGVAMYVFGFREGWNYLFPEHNALVVDLAVLMVLFAVAFRSAGFAFKAQYVTMAIIGLALVSIFMSPAPQIAEHGVQWVGEYRGDPDQGFEGTDFWGVFAVFFPGVTGILSGANMSGELKNPRRAIPVGTLAAIGISSLIYVAVAIWCERAGTLKELTENTNFLIEKSYFPPLVIAGLLASTASAALAGLVSGPRILMAMGQKRIVPFGKQLAQTAGGEPRAAIVFTALLSLGCVMFRDLNAIAPLVTMFFLITYAMINVVVLIEGGLGLVSFRPTFRLPLVVPALGVSGCLFSMFIVAPTFGIVATGLVGLLYFTYRSRRIEGDGDDVRSSLFVAFAEWAASKVTEEDHDNVRAWKPSLLVPVEDVEELRGEFDLLVDIATPEGSVKLLGLATRWPAEELRPRLRKLANAFRREAIDTTWSAIALPGYVHAVGVGLMALQGTFFRPNVLVVKLTEERLDEHLELIPLAQDCEVGVLLYAAHPTAGLGQRRNVNLWVRPGRDGWAAEHAFESGNLNLILLMGFRLQRLWGGELNLATAIHDEADRPRAEAFLAELGELARLPPSVKRRVVVGSFDEALDKAPVADLSILGLQRDTPNLAWCAEVPLKARGSCLYVLDSGRESARA